MYIVSQYVIIDKPKKGFHFLENQFGIAFTKVMKVHVEMIVAEAAVQKYAANLQENTHTEVQFQ